ncbi:MAG: hypothetical protein HYT11_00695 [Candidatus Levybacteria bacterium]|nr:hypothetical protein [Candidatus Levybacteria bacterium]
MGLKFLAAAVGIIILLIIAVAFFMLNPVLPTTSAQKAGKPANTAVAAKNTVSAANVIKDPLVYDGLTVEIESQIVNWITKRSFFVTTGGGSGGLLGGGGGGTLLVISATQFTLPQDAPKNGIGLGETVNVRMKGKVRIMDRTQLGQVLGVDLDGEDIKLDDNNIVTWRKGSVLILETVTKI